MQALQRLLFDRLHAHRIDVGRTCRFEQRTGIEARATVLGHVQRGGSPTAFDRVLATRTGIAGADAILHGEWGTMAGLRGDAIELVPLEEAVGKLKTVPADRYAEARLNFG